MPSDYYTSSVTWGDEPRGFGWLDSLTYNQRPRSERNVPYVMLGQALIHLGNMGASDEDLERMARKGPQLTFKDIAKVYCKNLREGDWRP